MLAFIQETVVLLERFLLAQYFSLVTEGPGQRDWDILKFFKNYLEEYDVNLNEIHL